MRSKIKLIDWRLIKIFPCRLQLSKTGGKDFVLVTDKIQMSNSFIEDCKKIVALN